MSTRAQALYYGMAIIFSAISLYVVMDYSPDPEPQITIDYIVIDNTPDKPAALPAKPTEPDVDEDELQCLAKNIYHEARGESRQGKLAVANVTLNRVHSDRFPDTVCGVVYQARYSRWWLEAKGKLVPIRNQCQFSWYCDGKSDRIQLTTLEGEPIVGNVKAWSESQEVALKAMLSLTQDNTGGATYYYNPHKVTPYWSPQFEKTIVIGNHKFMRAP